MNTLFLSFLVAIGGAVGLVSLSRVFDLETYTTRIFPLIPILYAIVYEALEKRKGRGKFRSIPPSEAREEMKVAAATIFQNITFERIVIDVGMSLLMKFTLELTLTATYLAAGDHSFAQVYGAFNIETV